MATSDAHTYGQACRLAPVSHPPADGLLADIPPLKAHFFYSSATALDDPLSQPTITGATDPKSPKAPLRPFSAGDNNTLEKAWIGFQLDSCRWSHEHALKSGQNRRSSLSVEDEALLESAVHGLVSKHHDKHTREWLSNAGQKFDRPAWEAPIFLEDCGVLVCCRELPIDTSTELRNAFCALTRKTQPELDQDRVMSKVMEHLQSDIWDVDGQGQGSSTNNTPGQQSRSRAASTATESREPLNADKAVPMDVPIQGSTADDGISGRPFLRVGDAEPIRDFSLPNSLRKEMRATGRPSSAGKETTDDEDGQAKIDAAEKRGRYSKAKMRLNASQTMAPRSVDIPVGISRLHQVTLPALQMKPIYWSPVNDISVVMRATWFYSNDMRPVSPEVANQLEAGYRELRVWSETWQDELRSALEVGAAGEEKLSHPLWPEDDLTKKKGPVSTSAPLISSDPFCAAKCYRGEAAAIGTLEAVHSEGDKNKNEVGSDTDRPRPYKGHHVIYKDASHAYLLSPRQRPSESAGRKPIAAIMKGKDTGLLGVVRGFDQELWDQKHNKQKTSASKPASVTSGINPERVPEADNCPGCERERALGQVKDLVLIAHGIGQKFAERVESFHFTHAVNAFRRAVNVELGSEAVKSVLRPGQNGIMVLPVNWRHMLRFEDGGPQSADEDVPDDRYKLKKKDNPADNFNLKDIEPNSIPAVRNMISDVMFDVPFYLSHHKPRMIAALVAEANRVYRLWCRNNPGFSQNGRVHLIAHSLGSVMAVDILSRQPNAVPPLDLSNPEPSYSTFEFDTKNLFLLGSPAGFFLLLERGRLMPRRGRTKPGADQSDVDDPEVVGKEGTFGCLAVDNIYNILAKEDPIAYLLNGTIDPKYAASLKTAYVPSTTTSLLTSLTNLITGTSATTAAASKEPVKPPSLTARLPSQLELEVHDFAREDVAEKKAYLLNDNGQVDYYLRSGGGPLEMQYLNMLSAHTSYWYNPDLIRMLCMEIGRRPGRGQTLPAMRAVKATRRVGAGRREG